MSFLPHGLYDQILTEALSRQIETSGAQAHCQPLQADATDALIDLVARQLSQVLQDLPGDPQGRAHQQLALVNELLISLRQRLGEAPWITTASDSAGVDLAAAPPRLLKAIEHHQSLLSDSAPQTGLMAPWLFTAGKASPSLLQELRRELASADQVDILVSFITVSGVRKLRDVLLQATAVGADGRPGLPIRILTTTYTGATEAKALDELARLPGCEVRISLDGRRTRLHAKAWIFRRHTGFGSAYIGSANLSGAALSGGLEWTVKLTQRAQEALFEQARAHFETLWSDSEFQPYDPDDPVHREALTSALRTESGETFTSGARIGFFDLQPKSYQQDMLEQLAIEREQGRWRNLVVAATGTGKTVVAAFDYRRSCQQHGGRPRLLFVAHREEILRQALRTFREVLRDPEFGDLLAGGHEPDSPDHLFATIDSVDSRDLLARHGPGHWHTVIIDECHRLAGERFDRLARQIRPRVLLGLTATPERGDGQPLTPYFDLRGDGSPAVELRLWHALDLQLLAPFEYYACDDETDLSAVPWDRAGERAELDRLLSGNDARARAVIREWGRLAADARRSRALVFCVSVAHAQLMAHHFNAAGLPAACIVGDTDPEERRRAPRRLEQGELCALVTVDLYNEGVDLPFVDTLLLLRPTQSAVVFQQQIGRGLRLSPNKESCLVLDFVGQHRADFRFDRLLGALTGQSRRELIDSVEHGFGSLPAGCHVQLQRQTRDRVLASLRQAANNRWPRLRAELLAYAAQRPGGAPLQLSTFLRDQLLSLEDIYRQATGSSPSGWTTLRRDAGLLNSAAGPEEAYFSRRFGDLLHIEDTRRLDAMAALARPDSPEQADALTVQMLAYQIDGQHHQTGTPEDWTERLAAHPDIRQELGELTALLRARSTLSSQPLPGLEDTPLCLHAAYGIREILTAVGWLSASRRSPFQAGVLPLHDRRTELLFVTLDKSEGYHDRIAYRDHAISTTQFHWQSQNSTGPDTAAGRRYLGTDTSAASSWQFQLFVRSRPGTPYRACGPVHLVSAEGTRPMNIIWQLAQPLPVRLFREFSVLRDV